MDKKLKLDLYNRMVKIRKFEKKVKNLFAEGEIPGFVHLYLGMEAVAAGTCAALEEEDYITSTHRGHGHILAKGADMSKMMAELFAKKTGYNEAKGGSQHIAAPSLGILGANGIVGGGIPLATGAALSAKYNNNNRVAVSFFGDGGANQGSFHESLNLASAFDLPCVYVCENNLYGMSTRQPRVRNIENIADRAQAYGIPGHVIDGNEVEKVYNVVKEAVKKARKGEGPALIECKTYKWRPHFEGDTDTYRDKEEVEKWKDKCPLKKYRQQLQQEGISETDLEKLEAKVEKELEKAIEFAENSPEPELESALTDVYKN